MSGLSTFARNVGVNVSTQAIDKRFTKKTATFFQELLNATFTQVVAGDPVAIPLLERFSEVIVEDSTTPLFTACKVKALILASQGQIWA